MKERRRGWPVAVLASIVVGVLLLFPVRLPPEAPLWQAAGGSIHILLFAGLAWGWGRALPNPARGWILWGALAVFSAGVEWLQPRMGRSAELLDWLYGAGGAAGTCATWRFPRRTRFRWMGILFLCLVPPAWEGAMLGMECQAFPVLAAPGACWAGRNWTLNGVELSVAPGNEFRLDRGPGDPPVPYPGVFRTPVCSDWRGMQSFQTEIFWPNERPALFAVRVDDRPGNPPYADRFQQEFAVTQGWNAVRIPAAALSRTTGGRPLQQDAIRHWGVFLVSGSPFDYFSMGMVRLVMQQEDP